MRIVVLFNLRKETDVPEYENWARSVDIPVVNGLKSIAGFSVHKIAGILGSDAEAPYKYVEIIDVSDMEQFGMDIATDEMKRIASQFQSYADNPLFLMTGEL